jgi:hypothetical protein
MSADATELPSHSPRTRGIIQHFERQVRMHSEALNEDVQVTNERIGQVETAQIETNNKLTTLERTAGSINTSLAAIIERLERMEQAGREERERRDDDSHNSIDSIARDDEMEYSADTELDDRSFRYRRQPRRNHHGMGGRAPRREVRANDDSLCRVKFSIPPFDGKYDPDAYLTWELSVDQKFACYEFSDDKKVRAATSEFTDFASVWWHEYQTKNPATIPQTWNALKRIMRNRFVPSYHARYLLHKLQQLRQGNKSVEEYYQELQIGMMICGLVENEEAAMARFLGGLNREI